MFGALQSLHAVGKVLVLPVHQKSRILVCGVGRDISLKVAMAVMKMAHQQGILGNDKAVKALEGSDEELAGFIKEHMYVPAYRPLVSLPVGVLE